MAEVTVAHPSEEPVTDMNPAQHTSPGGPPQEAHGVPAALNVLFVTDSFHPTFAGGALRFQRYIPKLRARGIEVQVLCGTPTAIKARLVGIDPPDDAVPLGEFLPDERLDDTLVHRVRLPDVQTWRRDRYIARALTKLCRRSERPDVVQLLSAGLPSVPALASVRRAGARIVFTGTMVSELSPARTRRALAQLRSGLPLRLVDSVVASSDVMAQMFRKLGVTAPLHIIPNGVDLEVFREPMDHSDRISVRRAMGIETDDPMLLYVGAVTPRKGIDLLLESWTGIVDRHPDSHLVIAGPERTRFDPAHADYHARLERLGERSGAQERVHYLGAVDNVPELMRAADLLVFPSQREGMGNVVLEAMASALPVVLTPFIGLGAELGRPGVDYLLARPDADSFAGAVNQLLGDEELGKRIARSARGWVERHMDVKQTVDRYAELYRSLAASSSAALSG